MRFHTCGLNSVMAEIGVYFYYILCFHFAKFTYNVVLHRTEVLLIVITYHIKF